MKKSIITSAIILSSAIFASSGVKLNKQNQTKTQYTSLLTNINSGKEIASAD